jgi:outer membrane immunogenic protein
MRKALLATVAFLATVISARAADLPLEPLPPPYVPPAFKWTGIYIGGNFGGAWAPQRWTDTALGIEFDSGSSGVFLSGGQIGGNYQFGNFVIGGEWELDYMTKTNNSHPGMFVPSLGSNVHLKSSSGWVTTVAARFGYAFDRVLVYGKAGGGWVGDNWLTITNINTGAVITTNNNTAGGWLLGAGVEWAFGSYVNAWTLKVEYNYLDLGSWAYTVPTTAKFFVGDTFTTNRNVQMLKVGFNYLFNGPISSRYY